MFCLQCQKKKQTKKYAAMKIKNSWQINTHGNASEEVWRICIFGIS